MPCHVAPCHVAPRHLVPPPSRARARSCSMPPRRIARGTALLCSAHLRLALHVPAPPLRVVHADGEA
eukprot:1685633-Prymnesium_polylepis.1